MENTSEDDRPFAEIRKNLQDALRMLSLHRWAFFVPFSTVTCAAFILSLYYPRTYQASTSFERRDDPVMMNLPMAASAASFKHFRNTMVRDLTSIECMRQAVENLELTSNLERDANGQLGAESSRQLDSIARSLASTLKVTTMSPTENLDVVRITYTGPDASIGTKLVDEVKHTYVRQTMEWIHKELLHQRDYFVQRLEEASDEVRKYQRAEIRLRLDNPHVDPSNPGAITLRLAQLEMEHRELLLRQREYKAELLALQQMLAANEPQLPRAAVEPNLGDEIVTEVILSARALTLSAQIQDLDAEVKRLRTTRGMTDQHPEIQQIAERRRWLADEFERQRRLDGSSAEANQGMNASPIGPPMDVAAANQPWQTERTRLLAQIAGQKSKLKDVEISIETNDLSLTELRSAKEAVFQRQEDFAEITGQLAQSRQKQRQIETTIASIDPALTAIEEGRLLHFAEGQAARGSNRPISPKATTVLLLALLAGLATGVVFVVMAEIFDHIFRSSGQVARALGLPMLESIDEIVTANDRRYYFLRRAMLSPMVILCFVALTGLTGSMAYLAIEQPWTYQRLRKIPEAAIQLFAG